MHKIRIKDTEFYLNHTVSRNFDCSDIDEKEEYTDDTVTSRDDVSRNSSSQFASFEKGEENSGEEEVWQEGGMW